jgi:hypothetical protein
MKLTFTTLLLILVASTLTAAEPQTTTHSLKLAKAGATLLADDFTQAEKANRRLTRGDWTVKDGIASCQQDDELFKKYNNHGPAIWYDVEFQDAVVRFDFLPSTDCKQFVFTINGKPGHVFRFVMNEAGTDVRAWNADHKAKQLSKNGPALRKGQWTPVTVEIVGSKASVQIGDSYHTQIEDPSYAAAKNVVGVSFHYGNVKLRNFSVAAATSK